MYLETNKTNECYGCMACVYACPTSCLSTVKTDEGFIYPFKDATKCINCNRCVQVCPDNCNLKNNIGSVFAGTSSFIDKSDRCSSGGIFSEIAKRIIANSGIVYGVELKSDLTVGYARIDSTDGINRIKGSKYVQCCLNKENYFSIKNDLKENKNVLFVGTPCQVAAVKNCFQGQKNLLTIDFVCHGVPSELLLKAYIESLEKKHNGKVVDLNFRNKEKYGWSITLSYDINKRGHVKRYYLPHKLSSYFVGFLHGVTLRESCYQCDFCSFDRAGDITLGDFWGIENIDPSMVNENGVSIVMCNTERGEATVRDINCSTHCLKDESSFKEEINHINKNLCKPTVRKDARDAIYSKLLLNGYSFIEKRYLDKYVSPKERLYLQLPLGMRKFIKKVLHRKG